MRRLLDEEFSGREPQPGETTVRAEAERYGVTDDHARDRLDKLVKRGVLRRRRAGRVVYYAPA